MLLASDLSGAKKTSKIVFCLAMNKYSPIDNRQVMGLKLNLRNNYFAKNIRLSILLTSILEICFCACSRFHIDSEPLLSKHSRHRRSHRHTTFAVPCFTWNSNCEPKCFNLILNQYFLGNHKTHSITIIG